MKIILNLDFCKRIWKSDIKKVKEPYRTKKLKECCTKMLHENNKTLKEAFKEANAKFLKDFANFNDFPADVDNFIVAPSIQLVESTFSTYRRVEKVDNLSKQVIYSETEFRKNNVMDWVLQQENAEKIISEATSSQTRKNTKRKNFDEDLEMVRKLLNRRLVYEPTIPKKKRKDS